MTLADPPPPPQYGIFPNRFFFFEPFPKGHCGIGLTIPFDYSCYLTKIYFIHVSSQLLQLKQLPSQIMTSMDTDYHSEQFFTFWLTLPCVGRCVGGVCSVLLFRL